MMRLAASYNPRPRDFLNIQQMFHDVYYTRFERLDNGEVESWDLYITPIDWHFNFGDSLLSGWMSTFVTSNYLSRLKFLLA